MHRNETSGGVESLTPEQERIEVCNDQLSSAMHELRNAIQRVDDIRKYAEDEMKSVDISSIEETSLGKTQELIFASRLMLQAFIED